MSIWRRVSVMGLILAVTGALIVGWRHQKVSADSLTHDSISGVEGGI